MFQSEKITHLPILSPKKTAMTALKKNIEEIKRFDLIILIHVRIRLTVKVSEIKTSARTPNAMTTSLLSTKYCFQIRTNNYRTLVYNLFFNSPSLKLAEVFILEFFLPFAWPDGQFLYSKKWRLRNGACVIALQVC